MKGRKGILLWVAAVALALTGAAGVAALAAGDFGETDGRILGSTAALAGASLLAVPGAILLDRGRLAVLAWITLALAAASFAVFMPIIWRDDAPEVLGKSLAIVASASGAAAQASALLASVRGSERAVLRGLLRAATVLVLGLAAMASLGAIREVDSEAYWRLFGVLAVLDLVAVLMRPIVRRMGPATAEPGSTYDLRLTVEPGGEREVTGEGYDLAAAIAAEVRRVEADGGRVTRIEPLAEKTGRHIPVPGT